jgi:hypothetical protein
MPTTTFDAATGKCRVVFRLPAEAGASQAWLAGEFNDWSTDALPLVPQDDGSLTTEIVLEPGRSYRFRYYLGDGRWDNDWQADAYAENEFGGADSVLHTPDVPDGGVVAGAPVGAVAGAPVGAVVGAAIEAVVVDAPPSVVEADDVRAGGARRPRERTSKRTRRVDAGEVVG